MTSSTRTYFPIDPSRPTPRGPDISYECLKCGDVIPSIEEARGPWCCRCKAIMLDFSTRRASFRDATSARGLRTVNAATPARAIEPQRDDDGEGLAVVVARRAGVTLTTRGGLLLVDFGDTAAFLDACAAEGVRVLGIEGFRIDASGVTPDMDAIADFSMPPGPGTVEEAIRASRTYLRAVKPDLMFEFVLDMPRQ